MVEGAVYPATKWCTDDERAIPISVGTVPDLCSFTQYLVGRRQDIIGKLDFSDRPFAHHGSTDRRTDDVRFRKRGVHAAELPVFFLEAGSHFEYTAFFSYILAKDKDIFIFTHFIIQSKIGRAHV